MNFKNFRTGANIGQVMTEYILLAGFLILGLTATWLAVRHGLFNYYQFLVRIVCLPIP